MAKIIYAVCGEGMGHAIRSKVVIQHLMKRHDVVIVSSGRAYHLLKKNFKKVYDIHYYHIVYEDNKVAYFKTLFSNIKKAPKGVPKAMIQLFKLLNSWEPDIVITDFEPFSDFLSKFFLIPIIAIDNMNIMVKGDIAVDKKHILDYVIALLVSRSFVIGARRYILTTFFYPEMKQPEKTVFVPPALRPEILRKKPTLGKHILVYQTSKSNTSMLDMLKKTDQQYIVYGFEKEEKDHNILFRNFSEKNFIKDLASAKAVIVNGGFTVVSEAIYFRKPLLSVPVGKQFEQILNASYIDKLGYGLYTPELTPETLRRFISLLPKYRNNLKYYKQDGNKILFKEVDKTIKTLLEEKSFKKKMRSVRQEVKKKVKKVQKTVRHRIKRLTS